MRLLVAAASATALLLPAVPAQAAPRGAEVGRALAAVERAGLDRDAAKVTHVRHGLVGVHVRGVQTRGGVPVDGSGFVVTSRAGKIVDVALDASELPGRPARRTVARADALRAAGLAAGTMRPLRTDVERLMVARRGRLVDTFRVSLVALRPALAVAVDVAAATGRVLAVRDSAQRIDVVGKLFSPNPTVTRRDTKLRQPLEMGLPADADLDSAELTAARTDVPLRGLDETQLTAGRLVGPHANVLGIAGYNAFVNRSLLDLTRGDPRFEGAMAYAHLDGVQRYFQSLGFTGDRGVNLEQQEIVATRVEGFDNSFYQPGNDLMLLGAGGVDDGEDAEVIVHEYGHATQDAQVPGYGATAEGGASGEGFGDFLAASFFAPQSGGFGDLCVADWDATSYASGAQPCLRRMDSPKRYPADIEGEVHADGELWSAFLWRVRAALGETERERTDQSLTLVLTMHELLTPQARFEDMTSALRTAAVGLGHPEWVPVIEREAAVTGFGFAPADA